MTDIIPTGEYSELLSMRQRVVDCMHVAEQALLEAAVLLYEIRERNLWLLDEEFLENTQGNPNWNDYVVWMSKYFDFKRTKLLDWVSGLRILHGGLGIEPREVLGAGWDLDPLIRLRRHLEYNWRTGVVINADELLKPRLPPGPDVATRLKQVVLDLTAAPNVDERNRIIDQLLRGPEPGDKEELDLDVRYFAEGPDHAGRWFLRWSSWESKGYFGKDPVPSYVLDDLKKGPIRITVTPKGR